MKNKKSLFFEKNIVFLKKTIIFVLVKYNYNA